MNKKRTRQQQLVAPPDVNSSASLSRWANAVTKMLQTGHGQTDPLDRFVTLRDVQNPNLLKKVGHYSTPESSGGGSGSSPGDQPPYTAPPAVTGLTASAAFSVIILEWDNPNYFYVSHYEVHRAETDDLGQATNIMSATSRIIADPVGANAGPYFYWVRIVSTKGDVGPFNAVNGVSASTSISPSVLLDVLTEQITETQLYVDLNSRIDLIDNPATGLLDRLTQEVSDRMSGDLLNAGKIDTLQSELDLAEGNVAANSSAISLMDSRVTANEQGITLQSERLDGLEVSLGNTSVVFYQAEAPAVSNEGDYWVDSDNNNAVQRYSGGAWVADNGPTVFAQSDAPAAHNDNDIWIDNDDGDSAYLSKGGLWIPADGSQLSAQSAAINDLISRVTVNEGTLTSHSSQLTVLRSDVNDTSNNLDAEVLARQALDARVEQNANNIQVNANSSTQLQSQLQTSDTNIAANATAIESTQTTVNQQSGQISALTTSLSQQSTSINGLDVALQEEATIRANQVGDIQAQSTLKIDANGYVAGYGFAVNGNAYDNSLHSDMIFNVDTFAISHPGSQSLSFVVDNNKVVMDAAYIVNLVVNDAQIQTVGVDKIIGDTASFVQANMGSITVGNANIIGYIESDNYVPGTSGWHINKDGSFFCEDGNFHGTIRGAEIIGGNIEGVVIRSSVIISDTPITTPTEANSAGQDDYLCYAYDIEETKSIDHYGWLNPNEVVSTPKIGILSASNTDLANYYRYKANRITPTVIFNQPEFRQSGFTPSVHSLMVRIEKENMDIAAAEAPANSYTVNGTTQYNWGELFYRRETRNEPPYTEYRDYMEFRFKPFYFLGNGKYHAKLWLTQGSYKESFTLSVTDVAENAP